MKVKNVNLEATEDRCEHCWCLESDHIEIGCDSTKSVGTTKLKLCPNAVFSSLANAHEGA